MTSRKRFSMLSNDKLMMLLESWYFIQLRFLRFLEVPLHKN